MFIFGNKNTIIKNIEKIIDNYIDEYQLEFNGGLVSLRDFLESMDLNIDSKELSNNIFDFICKELIENNLYKFEYLSMFSSNVCRECDNLLGSWKNIKNNNIIRDVDLKSKNIIIIE